MQSWFVAFGKAVAVIGLPILFALMMAKHPAAFCTIIIVLVLGISTAIFHEMK